MYTEIIGCVHSLEFDEAWDKWNEWKETSPSNSEYEAYLSAWLSLENEEDLKDGEHFPEFWDLLNSSVEDAPEPTPEIDWQLSQMLYRMAGEMKMDMQSIMETLDNFVGRNPNHKEGVRFFLEKTLENDWFIKFFEDIIDEMEDPVFAAECFVRYAHIEMNTAIYHGHGLSGFYLNKILSMLEKAKVKNPDLAWQEASNFLEGQELDPEVEKEIRSFQQEHF